MAALGRIEQVCVALTARCNLRCSYCYQNSRRRDRMSWRTLRASIDLLQSSGRQDVELVFLGGEPLLEYDLLRRGVQYAREHSAPRQNLRTTVLTNGLLLTDEVAEFLAAEAVDTQLSFDGVRAAQVERHPGTFDSLDRLLDRLRERWPRFFRENLTVVLTLTPGNVRHVADSFDYFLGKGVARILLGPIITPTPAWRPHDIDALDAQFSRLMRRARSHIDETGRMPLALLERASQGPTGAPSDEGGRPMCGIASTDSLVVDADGRVYACAAFAESYQRPPTALLEEAVRATKLGRLTDPGFAKLSGALPAAVARLAMFTHKERKRSGYRSCADCPHLAACHVCPAAVAHAGGDPDRIPDFSCAVNLVSLEHRKGFSALPSVRDRVRGTPSTESRAAWRALADAARAQRAGAGHQ